MKTKKKDYLLAMTELDDELIEKADPYNDNRIDLRNKQKKSRRNIHIIVGISGVAVAVLLVVVVFISGVFEIKSPVGQDPVNSDYNPGKTNIDVPTRIPMPIIDNDPATTLTPSPTPIGWKAVEKMPTDNPVNSENAIPTSAPVKQKAPDMEYLSWDEIQGSSFYELLPEKLFQYYDFLEAYTQTDKFGRVTLIWFTLGTGEEASNLSIRVRSVTDVPELDSLRVKAEETERYDITKYEIPYSQTVPKELQRTMENPVFQAEEFTREVLLKRIVTHTEENDEKYRVELSIEAGGYVFYYNYYGKNMLDIFPAFGFSPIPDKTPPIGFD